ncbi:DUF1206 domain-containing protein [Mycolicibacterium sp. CBM1]
MVDNKVYGAVDRATRNSGFESVARVGYSTSGVLHLIIAYIVLRLAFGGGGNADQSGALATLAAQPGGAVALWITAVGLFALALWRLAEAVVGSHPTEAGQEDEGAKKTFKRVKSVNLAVVYFGIASTAVRFATGGRKSNSADNAGLTGRLLQSGWGKTLLLIAAVGLMAVGGYHVYKGLSKKFEKDLKVSGGSLVRTLGMAGYTAKGSVLAGAGILLIIATLTADPAKGSGLDGAVKSLGHAPFGKFLLIAAALGLAAYGVYCFVLARFARM